MGQGFYPTSWKICKRFPFVCFVYHLLFVQSLLSNGLAVSDKNNLKIFQNRVLC